MGPASLELLDDAQQVADRAGKPVEPHHDQRFTRSDVAQQARQHRAAAVGSAQGRRGSTRLQSTRALFVMNQGMFCN